MLWSGHPAVMVDNGQVRRMGRWVIGRSRGADFAVSGRCRHQFADLGKGRVDADGCLVCPWHQSRYDVTTGRMVSGPRGFLGWHGRTPGYSTLIRAVGSIVPLRVGRVRRQGRRISVE